MQTGDCIFTEDSVDGVTIETFVNSNDQLEFYIMKDGSTVLGNSDLDYLSEDEETEDEINKSTEKPGVKKPKSKGECWNKYKNPAQMEKDRVATLFFLGMHSVSNICVCAIILLFLIHFRYR